MLGVLGFLIAASVLHISDAALQEGSTFNRFIENAIALNEKAVQSLPESVFPMEYLLKEAKANLEKILVETNVRKKFTLLKSALEKETQGLSKIGVLCEPAADCKEARNKAGESRNAIVMAVTEICESKRNEIYDIFTEIKSETELDFEMWTVGMEVLGVIEDGC
ncbi:hypothetical protein Q1695_004339 [Nippostrongylus brasiliensis]|nr:hypothetical protein Q1695_004339 [Nippostrongylus brasiliensis]